MYLGKMNKYITTSIAYPNADPHIGYALELTQADFLARYYRLKGDRVRFLTGLDEHGLKIQKAAIQEALEPIDFVERKSEVYKQLAVELQLTHDRFIRTTDQDHQVMAQTIWRRCLDGGDIYKKRYLAWYNVKEEEFVGLVEDIPDPSTLGLDPRFIEKIDEENYFFRLSRYTEQLREILQNEVYKVIPANRRQEILNFINDKGLQDISISREAKKLSWGIPVPGDPEQVMYVWFDALTNYLSGAAAVDSRGDIELSDFWPASIHCVGKDIQRFHALIWAGILLSAGLELPKELLVHGFLTSGGQKMSKSLGNVIDPLEVLAEYGVDAVRWYLLKEVPTTDDADFTKDRLNEVYQADLANDLGNLVSRVWTMVSKYAEGKVPTVNIEADRFKEVRQLIKESWQKYEESVEARRIHEAVAVAHQLIVYCNKRIDEYKPWQMAKEPGQENLLQELLYELLEIIRHNSIMLEPVLPVATERIKLELYPETETDLWDSFAKGAVWGGLKGGKPLGSLPIILYPKK